MCCRSVVVVPIGLGLNFKQFQISNLIAFQSKAQHRV